MLNLNILYFINKILNRALFKLINIFFKIKIRNVTKNKQDNLINNNLINFKSVDLFENYLVDTGSLLKNNLLESFYNKYKNFSITMLLIVPDRNISMGGYSLFNNWASSLEHMGVKVLKLSTTDNATDVIIKNNVNFFFMSDSLENTSKVDWEKISQYRKNNKLVIALTASSQIDGNTEDHLRLTNAKNFSINFFVSFRVNDFIHKYHTEWFMAGFNVISIPFAANPIYYFPISSKKPLDYLFLASTNPEKSLRYNQYLTKIFQNYNGIINGPGWNFSKTINPSQHSFLYSNTKIGLNLHIPQSINILSEINERTFNLAASGCFQLCDNPKAMINFFSNNSIITSSSPEEYLSNFKKYIHSYESTEQYRLNAINEVYSKNTYFHRMENLINYYLKV